MPLIPLRLGKDEREALLVSCGSATECITWF